MLLNKFITISGLSPIKRSINTETVQPIRVVLPKKKSNILFISVFNCDQKGHYHL